MSKTNAAVKTTPAIPDSNPNGPNPDGPNPNGANPAAPAAPAGVRPPANAPGTPGEPRPPTRPQKRRRDEMDFLPDALEILERPPSPTARTFTAVIMLAFTAACAWAWFGHVDVVAVAQGRVVPSDRTKTVQPMQTGVVRAIQVQDGQLVKAGQTLIELDPTGAAADRDRIRSDLSAARAEVARLRAALEVVNGNPGAVFAAPAGLSPDLARMQSQLLDSQIAEQRAKLAAIDREKARREADREARVAAREAVDGTVLNDLLMQRTKMQTGRYSGPDYFTLD